MKKGEILEVEISDIAFGGKGITRINDFALFVDQTVPLDKVRIQITGKKKNYAEARVIELLTPSRFRISPPCKYSGYCGGCKWQFLSYEKQIEYKRRHVKESLEHIALIKDIPVHPTIPSDLIFGYRNKMEFSCSDKRWLLPEEMEKEGTENDFALGLHVPGTFHKVLDIEACMLHPELGNQILNDVRNFIKKSNMPVYGLRTHEGFWRFLMLRHSAAYNQWMVNIITASEDRKILQLLADMLMEKYPQQIVSVVNNITASKAGIAIGEYEIPLAGKSALRDRIGKFDFEISANSFFQTNTRGAERLYQTVRKYAELTGKETVIDLYSGTGTIAIFLSDAAKEVIAMEIIESAVADAGKNCQINNISNCRFIQGDIRDSLSKASESLPMQPDVMIIDPPRVGMHNDVVKQVLQIAPQRIVYVSCNPATLARDIGMLKSRYQIIEVQPVDMFPHTHHIESVAKFERK